MVGLFYVQPAYHRKWNVRWYFHLTSNDLSNKTFKNSLYADMYAMVINNLVQALDQSFCMQYSSIY